MPKKDFSRLTLPPKKRKLSQQSKMLKMKKQNNPYVEGGWVKIGKSISNSSEKYSLKVWESLLLK
jgi:hypothetical protein